MDPWIYIVFVCLFLLSAFFSGTEIALMSLPAHKVESLVKQKKIGAGALADIKANTDRLLITILIGNNLVNTYAAALATQISLVLARNSGLEEAFAVALATGVITFLILMFGEIVPKSFASKNAESISLFVSPIYKVLMFILFPLVFIIEKIIRFFTGKNVKTVITGEEIESFIDMGKDSGALEEEDHVRLKNTLEFTETLVEEVMVPRVRLEALSDQKTVEEALEFYMTHTHSRIPVFHETIDNIIGIVTIRDILREKKMGNGGKLLSQLHFKKIIKTPLSQPIDVALDTFKNSRQHLAIVIDEYGGVAGIITLEDIIEEVFGEIQDETDFETQEIFEISEGNYEIDPTILMADILDEYELDFEHIGLDEREFGSETVSYIITHQLERFPEIGEKLCFPLLDDNGDVDARNMCFTVTQIDEGRIEKVTVHLEKSEH